MNYRHPQPIIRSSSEESSDTDSIDSAANSTTMAEELQRFMQFMEQQMNELRAVVHANQQGAAGQGQAAAQPAAQQIDFALDNNQIISHFNQLKQFSGDGEYPWRAFRSDVRATVELIRPGNDQLKVYCLSRVVSSKIVGKAAALLMEMPEEDRTWDTVSAFLDQKFRPKGTTSQLSVRAKELKVFTIKQLIEALWSIKIEANEIFRFNNATARTISDFDEELVHTLQDKLKPEYQVIITDNMTLEECETRFSRYSFYNSSLALANTSSTRSNTEYTTRPKPESQGNTQGNRQNNFSRSNFQRNPNFNQQSNSFNRNNYGSGYSGFNNRPNFQWQGGNQNFNPNQNFNHVNQNQNPIQNQNNANPFRNNTTRSVEPMEVDQIQRVGNANVAPIVGQSIPQGKPINNPSEDQINFRKIITNNSNEINYCRTNKHKPKCIVPLTIGGKQIKVLLDTGSDTNIIKPNTLPYETMDLQQIEQYSTLGGKCSINKKIITPNPIELEKPGFMEWKIFPLLSQTHDAIMGLETMHNFDTLINTGDFTASVNQNMIPFVSNIETQSDAIPQECLNAISIEPVQDPFVEIKNQLSDLNIEEKTKLKNLLINYKDLFYTEGEVLSCTDEVQHSIELTNSQPISTKIY